ncbi:hypothetical protein EV360DRAFT_66896 [Lentinula raphanica]|nr:hypothetical protein EV360DRAFT_66896 [Lentinula raphanica]
MPPRSAKTQKPHADYVCMSTVEDLSYTPSAEEKNRDAAQIVATGRRSWKTLRGRGEAVWPPHLSAADFNNCETHVKAKELISRRSIEDDADSEQQGAAYRQSPSVSPSVERSLSQSAVSQSPMTIWVHLALERSPWSDSSVPPLISLANNEKAMTQVIHLISKSSGMNFSSSRHGFVNTGLLSHLEPMVAFESPYVLETRCSFSVFMDGSGIPIHMEDWFPVSGNHSVKVLVAPTRFTIMQNVCLTPRASIGPADLSIIYNFTQPIPDNTEVLLHTMPEYTGNSATDFTFTRSSLTSASMRHWNDMIANDDSNSYHYSPVMFNSDLVPQYDISSAPRYDRASPQTSWGYGQRYTPTTHHIASGTPY